LGFVGSNLSERLHELGAQVTVLDPCLPGCGGKEANLAHLKGAVRIFPIGIEDVDRVPEVLENIDAVFNLAGEVSHSASMRDPVRDLEINTLAQLKFIRTLAQLRPGVRVVYASTRQVCGRPVELPVREDHPVNPSDYNGIHKRAAEQYHLLHARLGLLDSVVLRLTNTYGPRLALDVPGQGFLTVFLNRALAGQPIEVFGDGTQLRDPLYVNDAVDAFLRAGSARPMEERVFNVCGPEVLSLSEIARIVQDEVGGGDVLLRPFPPEHRIFDIGSYYGDTSRIAAVLGWRPRTTFQDGIRASLAHFREIALSIK
jgi:UDP-glucose 4-epimerase